MSEDQAGDPWVPRPESARTPPATVPPPVGAPPQRGWVSPAGGSPAPPAVPSGWHASTGGSVGAGGAGGSGAGGAGGVGAGGIGGGGVGTASGGRWASPGGPAQPDGRGWAAPAHGPAANHPAGPGEPVAVPGGGGIPLRPLSVGDILDGTFTTIRRNPRATIGLAALLVTVQQILVTGLTFLTDGLPTSADLETGSGLDAILSLQVLGGLGGLIGTLLSAVIGAVLTGMLVVVVSEDVLGRRVTVREVWARIRPRLWALLVAATITGLVPYLALVLLAFPGIILWSAWAVTTPAVVLERLGPFAAMKRSWQLVWPAIALVWMIRALSVVIALVIRQLVQLPFGVAGGLLLVGLGEEQAPLILVLVLALGSIAADTLALPFLAGVLALIYVDRRVRAEGMDLVVRRQTRLSRSMPTQLPAAPVPTFGGGR